MQLADLIVTLDEPRQGPLEHRFAVIFIELAHHDRLGKLDAGIAIALARNPCRVLLPDAGTGENAIKRDVSPLPIFSQQARLQLATGRKLIVIRLKERSLRVTYQENTAHVARSNNAAAPWPPPTHMVTTP